MAQAGYCCVRRRGIAKLTQKLVQEGLGDGYVIPSRVVGPFFEPDFSRPRKAAAGANRLSAVIQRSAISTLHRRLGRPPVLVGDLVKVFTLGQLLAGATRAAFAHAFARLDDEAIAMRARRRLLFGWLSRGLLRRVDGERRDAATTITTAAEAARMIDTDTDARGFASNGVTL
jgi:hypothetical protein